IVVKQFSGYLQIQVLDCFDKAGFGHNAFLENVSRVNLLQIAEPTFLMTSFHARIPTAGEIKEPGPHGEPPERNRQPPSMLRGNIRVGSRREELCMGTAFSQIPGYQRRDVNDRNVKQIEKERHTTERGQHVSEPPARPFGERKQRDHWPERHQQKKLRRGILLLVQEPEENRRRIRGRGLQDDREAAYHKKESRGEQANPEAEPMSLSSVPNHNAAEGIPHCHHSNPRRQNVENGDGRWSLNSG